MPLQCTQKISDKTWLMTLFITNSDAGLFTLPCILEESFNSSQFRPFWIITFSRHVCSVCQYCACASHSAHIRQSRLKMNVATTASERRKLSGSVNVAFVTVETINWAPKPYPLYFLPNTSFISPNLLPEVKNGSKKTCIKCDIWLHLACSFHHHILFLCLAGDMPTLTLLPWLTDSLTSLHDFDCNVTFKLRTIGCNITLTKTSLSRQPYRKRSCWRLLREVFWEREEQSSYYI